MSIALLRWMEDHYKLYLFHPLSVKNLMNDDENEEDDEDENIPMEE